MAQKHVVPLYRLELVREKELPYKSIDRVEAAAEVFHQMLDTSHVEKMAMIHCNSGGGMIGAEIVAIGSLEQVGTTMADLFKGALINNAASVWLAHNHVDGNVKASQPDFKFTQSAMKASTLLGLRLEDHLVIAPGKHYSIRDNIVELEKELIESSRDKIVKMLLGGLPPLPAKPVPPALPFGKKPW